VEKDGVSPLSNASLRRAVMFRTGGLPVVLDGKLYSSMIGAIMSYKIEYVSIGEIHEDMS
jgi:hypothetical protein